jgi:hypothetical protein
MTYDKQALIALGKEAANQHIQGGVDLSDAVVKVASQHPLNTNQIERVCQAANQATNSHMMKTSAYTEFPLVEPKEVMSKLLGQDKTASAESFLLGFDDSNSLDKTAGLKSNLATGGVSGVAGLAVGGHYGKKKGFDKGEKARGLAEHKAGFSAGLKGEGAGKSDSSFGRGFTAGKQQRRHDSAYADFMKENPNKVSLNRPQAEIDEDFENWKMKKEAQFEISSEEDLFSKMASLYHAEFTMTADSDENARRFIKAASIMLQSAHDSILMHKMAMDDANEEAYQEVRQALLSGIPLKEAMQLIADSYPGLTQYVSDRLEAEGFVRPSEYDDAGPYSLERMYKEANASLVQRNEEMHEGLGLSYALPEDAPLHKIAERHDSSWRQVQVDMATMNLCCNGLSNLSEMFPGVGSDLEKRASEALEKMASSVGAEGKALGQSGGQSKAALALNKVKSGVSGATRWLRYGSGHKQNVELKNAVKAKRFGPNKHPSAKAKLQELDNAGLAYQKNKPSVKSKIVKTPTPAAKPLADLVADSDSAKRKLKMVGNSPTANMGAFNRLFGVGAAVNAGVDTSKRLKQRFNGPRMVG